MKVNQESISALLHSIKEFESALVDALIVHEELDVDALNELAQESHFLQNIILKTNELYPGAKEPYDRFRF